MSAPSPPRGVTPARSRDHNRQLVLGHLHAGGALGRAELARRSGLSTQAVSNIIAELEQDGLLQDQGVQQGRRGLPARQYAVNATGAYALGLEVRPGAIFAALLDLTGQPVWEIRRPLDSATPAAVAAALPILKAKALTAVPHARHRLLGAGAALPGPFGRTGISGEGSELPGWEDVDPAGVLSDALDLPVTIENDANAAAISERIALAPEGVTTFASLYFGTGIGLAIVQDGRLVHGAFGNAGEIGHIPVATPAGQSTLEECLSRMSVERHMALHGRETRDMPTLEKYFKARDPALMEWIDAAAGPLSQAIGVIENLLDPQTILMCGAMPLGIVHHLAERVVLPDRSIARRSDNPHPALRVGTCSRMAATLGAAALVLNRTFTPALAA